MKKIVMLVVLTVMVLAVAVTPIIIVNAYGFEPNMIPNNDRNIAYGKREITSSGYIRAGEDEQEAPWRAFDGDINTKWTAEMRNYTGEDFESSEIGHWIAIDLEREYRIEYFVIYQASLGERDLNRTDFNLVQFMICVSVDGESWTEMYSRDDLEPDEEIIQGEIGMVARHFRFSSRNPEQLGRNIIRLPEIGIFGTLASEIDDDDDDDNNGGPSTGHPAPVRTPRHTPDSGSSAEMSVALIIGIAAAAVVVIGGAIVIGVIVLKKK